MYIRQTAIGTRSQYKHREIVEEVLQRKLTRYEVVHHVDNDPMNNAKTNLLVCNQKYHMELHARMRIRDLGFDHKTQSYCSYCKTCHDNTEFNKSKRTWNGLRNVCRKCP